MEAHHFGLCIFDDPAHGLTKRCEIEARRQFLLNSKLAIIGRQLIMPSVLAVSVSFRLGMTVFPSAAATPQLCWRRDQVALLRN